MDLVNCQFVVERPNQLWCAAFTYVSTAQGFAYVAFIITVFAGLEGLIVYSSKVRAGCSGTGCCHPGTIHHSDKGYQYVLLAYTQRLQERGCWRRQAAQATLTLTLRPRASKAEVIHLTSWKNHAEVELATLAWGDWFNNRRLLERLGHIPPVETEKAYYASSTKNDLTA